MLRTYEQVSYQKMYTVYQQQSTRPTRRAAESIKGPYLGSLIHPLYILTNQLKAYHISFQKNAVVVMTFGAVFTNSWANECPPPEEFALFVTYFLILVFCFKELSCDFLA